MRITYTAQREIAPVDYRVTALDISVSGTNSYSASSTVLTGINPGEWMNVIGFNHPANNGFHQVNTVSANQITVNETLVVESAGASITLDGFLHGVGQTYTLEQPGVEAVDRARDVLKYVNRALDGSSEALLQRSGYVWTLRTDWITQADLPLWDEFMASVEANELFTLDPYGTSAAPDASYTVEMDGLAQLQRVNSLQRFNITFSARVVA